MIGVVGVGAMGAALVEGLLAAGHSPETICLVEQDQTKLESFGDRGVHISTEMEGIRAADWVIVAVKPHAVAEVLRSMAVQLKPTAAVISIAAGIDTRLIEAELPSVSVVRAMPNTPALVGQAMIGVAPGRLATPEQLREACDILGAVGQVAVIGEADLDALTAVSGSGPAYLFYLAEALVEAAQEQGLSADLADQLVRQTLRGAGLLLATSDVDAAELRRRVTSKGGTTQAAIEVFDSGGMKATIRRAVHAATERSRQLRGDS